MPEAYNPEHVRQLVSALHPFVLGFDQRDFNAPTVMAAYAAKTGIFVDLNSPQDWEDGITAGVAGIQTDWPAELMAYLRARAITNSVFTYRHQSELSRLARRKGVSLPRESAS